MIMIKLVSSLGLHLLVCCGDIFRGWVQRATTRRICVADFLGLVPSLQYCVPDGPLSQQGTFVSAFVPCHAQADRPQREVRRPRARTIRRKTNSNDFGSFWNLSTTVRTRW